MDRSKWEYKKLGEVCTLLNGFAFKSDKYVDNGIRVMRITNVQKGEIVDDNPKYYPISSQSDIQRYMLKENDLLVSLTGNVGRVGLLHRELLPAALNQRVACLRIKDKAIDLRYIFHLMNSDLFESECIANSQGIAQKNMSTKWLENYKLPVPPIADQQWIVAELDCLNEMIALKQEQLKEFDKLAQSIFYDMFGDPVTNEKGWKLSKLGEIGELGRGVSKHRPRNAPELLGGNMPLIQTGDVANAEMYITEYNATYSELGVKQSKIWKAGTLCITIAATIGKCAILSFDACFPDSVVGFSTNEEFTNNEYIFYIFMSLQKMLEQNAPAVAQKNINLAVLNALDIPLPPLALQQQFAEKIQAIEEQKELVKKSIAETQHLLDSRMDYYFD